MKYIISIILSLVTTLTGMAQAITGKVLGENNSPLDYVNVVLLKADSTYVSGTITDENGLFLFENTTDIPKFVKLSSIGYTERIFDIPLSGNVGTVYLEPTTVMLGEVVVRSNRPVTAIKGDALVTSLDSLASTVFFTA